MQEQPMELTMHERKAVTNELVARNKNAAKAERGRLRKEFCQLSGYAHCYTSHVFYNWGTRHTQIVYGDRVEVVIGVKPSTSK
jgi:hypothetical protein